MDASSGKPSLRQLHNVEQAEAALATALDEGARMDLQIAYLRGVSDAQKYPFLDWAARAKNVAGEIAEKRSKLPPLVSALLILVLLTFAARAARLQQFCNDEKTGLFADAASQALRPDVRQSLHFPPDKSETVSQRTAPGIRTYGADRGIAQRAAVDRRRIHCDLSNRAYKLLT